MTKNDKDSTILDQSTDEINATPIKEFFISMLIKDITLRDAIGDLIDNSVDGAKRSSKNDNLNGYEINILLSSSKFEIEDNCGGIELDIAKNYAFRFGRPIEHKIEKHSIGQFGIGMKRAFFKIGNFINVVSTTKKSKFEIDIDVTKWQKISEDKWNFKFKNQESKMNNPTNLLGTKIVIEQLSEDSKENFGLNNFLKDLVDEIGYEHLYNINKGLKIKINNSLIKPPVLDIIYNNEFIPAYRKHKFGDKLSVEILAGISKDIGEEGGWYIFCNDRLITGPDISSDTGWTGRRDGKDGVAAYHDQFHRFRGFVFFNAIDASNLPWNTTKTGVDQDSSRYQFVRKEMIDMMKPIMRLMNQLKKEREKDKPKSERILNQKVIAANISPLSLVLKNKKKLSKYFIYPEIKYKNVKLGIGTIKYSKPYSEIDFVKKYFKITTNEKVGESTFEYFYNNEI